MGFKLGKLLKPALGAAAGFFTGGPLGAIGGALSNLGPSGAKGYNPAGARFTPFNVRSGLGDVTFEGGQARYQLAAPYQAAADQMTTLGRGFLSGITAGTPMDITNQAYGLLRGLSMPEEANQRASLENRLFKQGMLGSTGGAIRSQAFEQSVGQNQLQQMLQSFGLGSQLTNEAIARAQGLFTGSQAMYAPLDTMARTGLGLGSAGAEAGYKAGFLGGRAGEIKASEYAGGMKSLWPGISGGLASMFPDTFGGGVATSSQNLLSNYGSNNFGTGGFWGVR